MQRAVCCWLFAIAFEFLGLGRAWPILWNSAQASIQPLSRENRSHPSLHHRSSKTGRHIESAPSGIAKSFHQPIQASTQLAALSRVDFDRIDQNLIYFSAPQGLRTPQPLKTSLYEMNYLGALRPADGGYPYFLIAAKPCDNCLEVRTLYAIRPTGGKPTAFVYPGKILDPKNHDLLYRSRAFFGKCLPHRGDALVVYQDEKTDRKTKLQSSVLVAEAGTQYLLESLFEHRLPPIQQTLHAVKRRTCFEIEGNNRLMLSKPLELSLHVDDTDDGPGEGD